MASITKKDNGKWIARVSFRDSSTNKFKTKSGSFRTKVQANEWARKIELEKNDTDLSKQNVSFFDYYTWWAKTYRKNNISHGSQLRYDRVGEIIKSEFHDTPLTDITKPKYQEFLNKFGKDYSKETVTRLNSYIRSMCLEAIDEQIIKQNFTRKAKISFGVEAKEPDAKFLELDDFENLMSYSIARYSFSNTSPLMIFFICQTGARFEEASGLSWEDIDFDNLLVSFKKAYKINPRKVGPLKNKYSYRTISISQKLADLLKQQKQVQEAYYKANNKKNEYNFVFRNQRLENPSNRTVNDMLSNMLTEIDAKKQVSIHDLRHTHVSYLIANSYDILFISNRIGHADASTTLKVYSHLMKNLKDKENNNLRTLFN
ncbi:MAG TPA: hypothetical protein DEQ50_05075 [Lactobacillus sp.]|nr:hypothetical protein [Lactobacillus sp.]